MDYKNKHREEIARATQLWECGDITRENLEYIFPELNKDERIRKIIRGWIYTRPASFFDNGISKEEILAWLEKQSEQKLSLRERYKNISESEWFKKTHEEMSVSENEESKWRDKVQPKFNVGYWIVNNNSGGICQVTEIRDNEYCLWPLDGEIMGYLGIVDVDNDYHLWTIKDAKDGDVLSFNNNGGCIICKCPTDDETYSYCRYENNCFVYKEKWGWRTESLVPATKEQREQLFKAMHEAGYEFDFEKKELKKFPNALEECEIEHIEHGKYYYCIKDYYSGGCKRASKGEVVQALRGKSMMALGAEANKYFIPVKCIVGIKPAWGEEDEKMVNKLIGVLDGTNKEDYHEGWEDIFLPWLKSLKDKVQLQNKWKPNKDQIIALRWVLNNIPYNKHKEEISGLIDQIKIL